MADAGLVMFPRVDLLLNKGGARDSRKRKVLLPLVVFVQLDRSGRLRPALKSPWIPREWLGPNQSAAAPIADVESVDIFVSENPFEGIESWRELVSYCTHMLCFLTATLYKAPDEHQPGTSLFDLKIHADYVPSEQGLLQIEDLPVVDAKGQMFKVLDELIEKDDLPSLYGSYVSRKPSCLKPSRNFEFDAELASQHIAQMSGEFPLSPKQRNALHHFLKQEDGEILAVNGAPGTGKTALLLSVVANLWTRAPLDEAEPPLIVATSNNNQAVTNILENFAKVDEAGLDERLIGRWLPEIGSYGLYCRAGNKANDKNPYLYHGTRDEGRMQVWQTQEYFGRACHQFLQFVERWRVGSGSDLLTAKKALHQAMVKVRGKILLGIESLKNLRLIEQEVVTACGGVDALRLEIKAKRELESAAKDHYEQTKKRLDEVYALWEGRTIWVRLLSLIPGIGQSL